MTTPRGLLTAKATLSPFRGSFNQRSYRELAIYAYAVAVASLAFAMTASFVLAGHTLGPLTATAVLAAIAFYTELQPVHMTPTVHCSAVGVVATFAVVLLGPLSGIVVAAVAVLPALRQDSSQRVVRWVVWTSSRVVATGLAGLAVLAIGAVPSQAPALLLATIALAALVGVLVDLLLAPLPAVIRGRSSWAELFRVMAPVEFSALPVQIPLITALAYVYMHVSSWGLVLFVVPAFAAQRLYVLYRHQRETAEQLERANFELSSANLSFATALVATLDARDQYTAGHSAAVAIYARDIAARMELPEADQRLAHLSGLVHDIGKVGLPAGLLEKSGPLTLQERRQMEQHPIIGERILNKVENYREVARIVRHHHERMDGTGYPDHLFEHDIPLVSRIIAVADAYNAMTSDRPYRAAMPSQIARVRLAQSVGTQLDTNVVAAFEAILATASEGYRTATGADFQTGVHDVSSASSIGEGDTDPSDWVHGDAQMLPHVVVANA